MEKPSLFSWLRWSSVIWINSFTFFASTKASWKQTGIGWLKSVWPHFWLLQMWLAVLFLIFCALRELIRVIGRDKFIHYVFLAVESIKTKAAHNETIF